MTVQARGPAFCGLMNRAFASDEVVLNEPQGEPAPMTWAAPAVLAVILAVALTIGWGLSAQSLLAYAERSVRGLF